MSNVYTTLRRFLQEVSGEPPLTEVEVYELAEIHPDGRDAFYRKVKREWYGKILVGSLALYIVEYTVFSLSSSWWYAAPILPILYIAHQLKWERKTNYGALARAKLEQPREWPTWKRRVDAEVEREKIRRNNTVKERTGGHGDRYVGTNEIPSVKALDHEESIERYND